VWLVFCVIFVVLMCCLWYCLLCGVMLFFVVVVVRVIVDFVFVSVCGRGGFSFRRVL